jgi:hypothetical protein
VYPGTHRHSLSVLAAVLKVLLCAGHSRHVLFPIYGLYEARAQGLIVVARNTQTLARLLGALEACGQLRACQARVCACRVFVKAGSTRSACLVVPRPANVAGACAVVFDQRPLAQLNAARKRRQVELVCKRRIFAGSAGCERQTDPKTDANACQAKDTRRHTRAGFIYVYCKRQRNERK